tara:strand:- start:10094 stop:10891 length:798 start_codon:yes stop_codon:yes gene_type:complete
MERQSVRRRVAGILAIEDTSDGLTRVVNGVLLGLIVLNTIALIVGTVKEIHALHPEFFRLFERGSIIVFGIEYVLRIWSAPALLKYSGVIHGRVRFALTPLAIIDLLAIAPALIPMLGIDLRSLRMLRLLRVFRIAKVARYSKTLALFSNVARAKSAELITVLALLVLGIVMASTMVYFAEARAQPEKFSSIPTTMWWAVAALTTVGYGDMAPVTDIGRLLGGVISVFGIGIFALPAGILGSGFITAVRDPSLPSSCPHCGEGLE